jgi:hypothetical protein
MTDPRMWTTGKKMLGLVGVLVLAAAAFQGLESLTGRPAGPATKSESGNESSGTRQPVRPILVRENDWTIHIKEDRWRRSTFRFNEDGGIEKADAVYACLEEGISREFDDNPTTRHSEMRSRTKRIRDNCSPVRIPRLEPLAESE